MLIRHTGDKPRLAFSEWLQPGEVREYSDERAARLLRHPEFEIVEAEKVPAVEKPAPTHAPAKHKTPTKPKPAKKHK